MSQGSFGSPRRPRYADDVVHSANGRISTSSPISVRCSRHALGAADHPGQLGNVENDLAAAQICGR